MGVITIIIQVLKIAGKFLGLMIQRDAKKAEAQALEMDRLTNAAKETDPAKRASKLNRVLDNVRGL